MAFGDGQTEGDPYSPFYISGDTGHDQPLSDFLFCYFPKVLHAVHVLCCLNQVTQSVLGLENDAGCGRGEKCFSLPQEVKCGRWYA